MNYQEVKVKWLAQFPELSSHGVKVKRSFGWYGTRVETKFYCESCQQTKKQIGNFTSDGNFKYWCCCCGHEDFNY